MLRMTQNSFTKGELDPTLLARYDVDLYTKGARKLRNMVGLWTGAAKLAPGLKSVAGIFDLTASPAVQITNPEHVNATKFEYDSDENIIYTIVIRPDTSDTVAIDIFFNQTLQTSVAASAYNVNQIKDIRFVPGQDRILLLHEDVQPRSLRRLTDHDDWSLSTLNISTYPTFDFTTLGGTQYRVDGFTFTPGATSGEGVALTASSAIFTSNHVGGIFIGAGGYGRITAVSSTTAATIDIVNDFSSASAIKGRKAFLSERMWTSGGGSVPGENRGWPSRGRFYINRLLLGHSKTLRNIIAFSSANVFDDFNDAEADDTSGFSFSLRSGNNDILQDIVGDDSLIFLGASNIYATNPLTETPITPSGFSAPPQGGEGSNSSAAVIMDNQIFHISANRTQVIKTIFDTGQAKLRSIPATLLSSHLVNKLTSNAGWNPDNIQAKFYLATQEDGSLLMLDTLDSEAVNSWSLRNTRGKFEQVLAVKNDASAIVSREVSLDTGFDENPNHAYYVSADFDAFLDITDNISDGSTDTEVLAVNESYILLGNNIPFTKLNIILGTISSSDAGIEVQYLDGNDSWNNFNVTDGTNGFTQNGEISWAFTDVSGWEPNDIYDTRETIEQKFWLRIRRTTTEITTAPEINEIETNTITKIFLEDLSFDDYMDGQVTTSSDASGDVTGLTQLAGQQVYAIANGNTTGPFFVDDSGATNISEEHSSVKIGVQFKPKLIPMPVLAISQEGDNIYKERHIQEIYIDYHESLYIQAEGKDIPVINVGSYTLGSIMKPQSGFKKINPMGSWEPRQEITISQAKPGPMTIRGIGYHIEVT